MAFGRIEGRVARQIGQEYTKVLFVNPVWVVLAPLQKEHWTTPRRVPNLPWNVWLFFTFFAALAL